MYQPKQHSPDMSETDFQVIADIAHQDAGLVFTPEKASLVRSRINRRLRKLGIKRFSDYIAFITSQQGEGERKSMIYSLTTNISSFFREPHHFDLFANKVFPKLLSNARNGGRVRIWSAGCSSGQEPYSIAMTMHSIAPDLSNLDVKVLATDIDADVLEIAKTGFYHPSEIENISAGYQKEYFSPSTNGTQKGYLIDQRIRGLISFRELNLLHDWPMNGLFDAIFCRNVVIYFDESTQLRLWPRFEKATAPGGWLFVGHSERLSEKLGTSFQNVGPTTYRLPN
ncbi:MAG TPA: hypothetical protein ENK34_03265 [Rhodobacteraceae bacterium]|nr:hypothetical protein [Paracoccaceae bacterium]